MLDIRGNIYSRETFGTVDGPGIRYVLFLQGCPLRCLYCHNPDSQSGNGKEIVTVEDTVKEILRYKNFIGTGGVTFSGGEPLVQAKFVYAMTRRLHEEGIHVAIDTSGCMPLEEEIVRAINEADMLLLDIKASDDETGVRLTGQDVENNFATLDYCEQIGKPVWIRHVLVTGYTLEDEKLRYLGQKLKNYKCIERLELLPFHKMGESKWENLKRDYKLYDTPATTKEQVAHAKSFFADCTFPIFPPT